MNHSPYINIHTPASLSSLLPEQFKNDWLPGSLVASATGNFGAIAIQSISVQDISIYYIAAEPRHEVIIRVTNTASFFFMIVQLNGSYEVELEKKYHRFGKQNSFSLFFITDPSTIAKLPAQEKASFFVFACTVPFSVSLLSFHPLLSDWKEKLETKANLISEEYTLSAPLSEKIYSLLHTPFVPLTEEYYLHTCKEIMQEAFIESAGNGSAPIPFDMYDISCIHAVKEYLDTHILEHPTIAQLSRKAGINRLKLKKGFKAIYGVGVYGYQLQQRLLIAKAALEKTTKPVHQIARQAGYRNTSNFSAAFKRVYGISPYRYRHTMRQH